MVGVGRMYASYSLGPADTLAHFVTQTSERYWCGRSVRIAGRDILILAVYLPPGDEHTQARQDTLQDLASLLRHIRGCWVVVGDFNQHPEELAATGFLTFVQGTAVATHEPTCRQGGGSIIDYAIVQASLAPAVSIERDLDSPWGPHYGLRVRIQTPKLDDFVHTWSEARPFRATEGDQGIEPEFSWLAGKHVWEARFGKHWTRAKHPVRPPVDMDVCSETLTAAYSDFSARAEVHILSCTDMLDFAKGSNVGRGRARSHRVVAMAKRTPEVERYYERTANLLARTRFRVLQLAKARSPKYRFSDTEVRSLQQQVRESVPLLRECFEQTSGLAQDAGGRGQGVLQLLEDLEEGRAVTALRLAVLGARIEQVIEVRLREASLHRRTDFRQWIRDHLEKGAKALHRFTNQANKPLCVVDEIHMDNAVLYC
jgi:hypothetical protein